MKTIIAIGVIILGFVWWYVGGIHLEEISYTAPARATELGFENCVREGYQHSIVAGFGGRVWFLCERDGNMFSFALSRRVNSSELQMYELEQETKFPSTFNLNGSF